VTLVVVGVDGSEQSRRALDWAVTYAAGCGAAVQAVMTVGTKDVPDAERADLMIEAETVLTDLVAAAVTGRVDAPPVASELVEGDPAVVLVDATRRADLMVLGSHGMSQISNPVLGSVSLACIRLGSCPVLVIPAGRPDRVTGEQLAVPGAS
jgi:nucleotide-binding universal stress UspA family protein